MPASDDAAIVGRIQREIAAVGTFINWHGITSDHLSQHLVEPYRIDVQHCGRRVEMWVVVHERPVPPHGLLIAFWAEREEWCLVEQEEGEYVCEVEGDGALADALSNM